MSSSSICAGMEQIGLTHGGEKAQVQSVLLLTDGLANQGITSKEGILAEMRKMQDQGLHAVAIPSDNAYNSNPFVPIPRAPQHQRRGLHVLFGRNARRQQNQQQQQQQPMQMQQAAPIPQLPPQPMQQQQQQQMAPPPPPPPAQQLVVPQPMQQQQQAVPAPPPPPQLMQQQQQQAVPMQQSVPPPPLPPKVLTDTPPVPDGATSKPIPPGAKVLLLSLNTIELSHSVILLRLQFDGTVYTFGFGSDHDATLLEAISTQGGGVYYYIDSNEKVPPENMIIKYVHHVSLIMSYSDPRVIC